MRTPSVSTARGAAWAALSSTIFAAAFIVTLATLAFVSANTDLPHVSEMAAWPVVWGALAVIGVYGAARVAFGVWLPIQRLGVAVAAVGLALSAIAQVVLIEWEIARGISDPEQVGWTAGLFAVLIGLAVAAFGALIAPKAASAWPMAAVLLAACGVALIVMANIPGLADGIGESSWPLAILVGTSALYAVATAGLIVTRAARRLHHSAESSGATAQAGTRADDINAEGG